MPLISELVAFQIPPSMFCGLGIQRKILVFKVVLPFWCCQKNRTFFNTHQRPSDFSSGYAFPSEEDPGNSGNIWILDDPRNVNKYSLKNTHGWYKAITLMIQRLVTAWEAWKYLTFSSKQNASLREKSSCYLAVHWELPPHLSIVFHFLREAKKSTKYLKGVR